MTTRVWNARGRLVAALLAATIVLAPATADAATGGTDPQPADHPTAQEDRSTDAVTPDRGSTAGGTTVAVPGIEEPRFTAVSTGASVTIALESSGVILTWGNARGGFLGDADRTPMSPVPVRVDMSGELAGKTIVDVEAGTGHFFALDSEGRVYGWGRNGDGELGLGMTGAVPLPRELDFSAVGSPRIVELSAGERYTLAVTEDGRALSWGWGDTGRLGSGSSSTRWSPGQVSAGAMAGLTVRTVAAGKDSALAIASNGRVYGWGAMANGVLGNGVGAVDARTAVPVATDWTGALSGRTAVAVAVSEWRSSIVTSDGGLFSAGGGLHGSVGNGSTAQQVTFVSVDRTHIGDRRIVAVTRSWGAGIALAEDGSLFTWGRWVNGFSVGGTELIPRRMAEGELGTQSVAAISGGYADLSTVAVLTTDGRLLMWGEGGNGSLGHGDYDGRGTPVVSPGPTVQFGDADATAVTAGGPVWTALTPAHAPGLVDVTVSRGSTRVVYPGAFRFVDLLAPEVSTHPESALVPEVGQIVTLTSAAWCNDLPEVTWQWSPRGADDWQPVTEGVTSSAVADGEVVVVTTALEVPATAEAREYRVVYANQLGVATTEPAWVMAGTQRPAHLSVTPRTVVVESLPGTGTAPGSPAGQG